MSTFELMTTEEEMVEVVECVKEFSHQSVTPFWRNIGEVALGFTNPSHLTYLFIDEMGNIEGYVHGYFLSPVEFYMSQAFHPHGVGNGEAFEKLATVVKEKGAKKLLLHIQLPQGVGEKYGLKFERTLMSKML